MVAHCRLELDSTNFWGPNVTPDDDRILRLLPFLFLAEKPHQLLFTLSQASSFSARPYGATSSSLASSESV